MATLLPREIKKLTKGIIPDVLINKPFLIIRDQVKFIIGDEANWEYRIIKDTNRRNDTIIDRKVALEIIENNKMELTHSNKYGDVYEMTGNPFLATYGKENRKETKKERKHELSKTNKPMDVSSTVKKKRGRKPKNLIIGTTAPAAA